jgi:hypothetical protein
MNDHAEKGSLFTPVYKLKGGKNNFSLPVSRDSFLNRAAADETRDKIITAPYITIRK